MPEEGTAGGPPLLALGWHQAAGLHRSRPPSLPPPAPAPVTPSSPAPRCLLALGDHCRESAPLTLFPPASVCFLFTFSAHFAWTLGPRQTWRQVWETVFLPLVLQSSLSPGPQQAGVSGGDGGGGGGDWSRTRPTTAESPWAWGQAGGCSGRRGYRGGRFPQ